MRQWVEQVNKGGVIEESKVEEGGREAGRHVDKGNVEERHVDGRKAALRRMALKVALSALREKP